MPEAEVPQSAKPAFEVPRHVAIIMDGNGRWAAARGLPRAEGHRRGVEALRRTIRAAGEIGIGYITIFSFSAENWSRPASEVHELMGLLRRFIRNDLAELHQSNVRVRIIGEREGLDPDIGRLLTEAEELTRNNSGLTLVVAFNYGSRQEIARAARRIAEQVAQGRLPAGRCHHGDRRPVSSMRRTCPIPISSSAPAANSACPISCSGSRPIANWCSCRPIGRTSTAPRSRSAIREYQQRERRFGGLVAKTGS